MEQHSNWLDNLTPITGTPYYRSENGNIYSHHSIYIKSGVLHAKQIESCLTHLLGHNRFVVNTVIMGNRYTGQTFIWLDDENDFKRIIRGEIVIPPIPLNLDQIDSLPEKEVVNGCYPVKISATYITPGVQEGRVDNQFYIRDVPHPSISSEILHQIFDHFAISSPDRRAKITVSEKSKSRGEYWALIEFANRYDCAFAYRLARCVTCRDKEGNVREFSVIYSRTFEDNKYNRRNKIPYKKNERVCFTRSLGSTS